MTDEELLADWGALEPPVDFAADIADRVVTPEVPIRKRRWPWLAAAAALILAAVITSRWPASGQITYDQQASVSLADRAFAVPSDGANLAWETQWSGALNITQDAGRAFYRAAPGSPISITTPGGQITTRGACMTVEVSPMGHIAKWKQPLLAGLAGAALSAAVLVTVYEGEVDVNQAGAAVQVAPGQRVAATAGTQPQRMDESLPGTPELATLKSENERLQNEVAALESAIELKQNGATSPQEVQRLRKAVADMERALEQEHQVRAKEEGTARPFPEDLPADYREDGMRSTFEDAIAQAGLDADIFEVDCAEFPCIVYGETRHAGKEAMDKEMNALQKILHERFEEGEHDFQNSVWGNFSPNADRQENVFGMAIYPKSHRESANSDNADLKKRMRFRQTTFMDSWRAEQKPTE